MENISIIVKFLNIFTLKCTKSLIFWKKYMNPHFFEFTKVSFSLKFTLSKFISLAIF
jgi:hypothetical protein